MRTHWTFGGSSNFAGAAIVAAAPEIAALKADYDALMQLNSGLQKSNQEFKVLNVSLTEKNDMMQYEMIKYRAQASGLERICANYKEQLEGLLARETAG